MYSIDEHEKYHSSSCDDGNSGGGCPLQPNSATEAYIRDHSLVIHML